MRPLADLLESAVGGITPTFSFDDVAGRAAARRRRARAGQLAGAVGAVVVAVLATSLVVSGGDRRVVAGPPKSPMRFSTPTNGVLVFDDGYDGLTVVDVNTGEVARRISGQRAGDQVFRLFRSGDHLVTGWGEISAFSLASGTPTVLGEATVAIPSATSGRAWLVSYPGGGIGSGPATAVEVSMDGTVHRRAGAGDPLIGDLETIYQAEGSWTVSLTAGRWAYRPSSRQFGYAADPQPGDLWLSCTPNCADLDVHEEGGPTQRANLPGSAHLIDREDLRFSPDGRRLALLTEAGLVLLDRGTNRARVIGTNFVPDLAWTPDGTQLLAFWDLSDRYLGRYDVRTGRWEQTTLAVAGLGDLVVVEPAFGPGLLDGPRKEAKDCPPPVIDPSRRDPVCVFSLPPGR